MVSANDISWMRQAILLANKAAEMDEVPVGALIVKDGKIIGEGCNQPIHTCDPSAHAEIVALRAAAKYSQNYRLPGSTMYVTIEPCTMCFGAMIHARIERLVYGAPEPKAGVINSQLKLNEASHFNHVLKIESGVLESECSALLSAFFKDRRKK